MTHKAAICFAALAALAAGMVRGQNPPPAGGFVLREVAVLTRVAEPAGGLIPYRQGPLWGYADSTGRVWIQPVLPAEPTFFVRGLATLQLTKPLTANTDRILGTVLLNARGECLRLSPKQVAVLRPDSTLERREQAAAVGQRTVESVYYNWGGAFWGIDRARPLWGPASRRGPGLYVQHHLVKREGYLTDRYTLHDAQGKRLTKQFYTSVYKFQGGWGKFEGDNYYTSRPDAEQGLVNRQGQEIGGRFYYVSGEYSATLASVQLRPDGGAGLIDTTGRFVLGPSDEYSYGVPDSAGLVLRTRRHPAPGAPAPHDFVRLDGQVAFPSLPAFYRPSGFGTDDRRPLGPDLALVYAPGGIGILDRTGHWRVAPRYTTLTQLADYNKLPRTSFYAPYRDDDDLTHRRPPELGVLLAERDGKLGMVRLRDGQEIIPARYAPDKDYGQPGHWPLYRGFAGFFRDGQHYLVNARGEEVAKGQYRGWDFRIRSRRYLFLELDKSSAEGGRFWALVDTAGRPWLPPLTRPSLLRGVSPAGLLLVHYLDGAAGPSGTEVALDPQGREVLTGLRNLTTWHSLVLAGSSARAGSLQLFDATGHSLRPAQLYAADTLRRAQVLVGHLGLPGTPADSLLVLDGQGHRWATLPPTWQPLDWPGFPPPHEQGRLVPVVVAADKRKLGYLTRGGRRLWAD